MNSNLKSGPCSFYQVPPRLKGKGLQCMLSPFGRTVYVTKDTIEHYMCIGNLRDTLLPWTSSDVCSSQSLLAEFLFASSADAKHDSNESDRLFDEFVKVIAESPTAKKHILTPDDEYDNCKDEENIIFSDPLRKLQSEARRYAPSAVLRYVAMNVLSELR